MHGQSNAVNSPASSVQNTSASSQHVQQPMQKLKAKIYPPKTIRCMEFLNLPGQAPNMDPKIRKQAEIKLTADQINCFKEECTPDLAARSIAFPIKISDNILNREPLLLTLQMCHLLNKFMDFVYDKCLEIESNELKQPPLDALFEEFNELPPQPNSTTNMRNLQKSDFYSVRTYKEIKQAVKNKSNVHHLYVQEGQACKSVISLDENEKVIQFITFSVKYIHECRHRG